MANSEEIVDTTNSENIKKVTLVSRAKYPIQIPYGNTTIFIAPMGKIDNLDSSKLTLSSLPKFISKIEY